MALYELLGGASQIVEIDAYIFTCCACLVVRPREGALFYFRSFQFTHTSPRATPALRWMRTMGHHSRVISRQGSHPVNRGRWKFCIEVSHIECEGKQQAVWAAHLNILLDVFFTLFFNVFSKLFLNFFNSYYLEIIFMYEYFVLFKNIYVYIFLSIFR